MKFISKIFLLVIMTGMLVFSPLFGGIALAADDQQGDVVKFSDDIYVNEGTTIDGNVVSISGNVYVNGSVTGDVVSVFGDIIVNKGKVLGDAVSVTGKITVGDGGKIMGDTVEATGGVFKGNSSSNYKFNITPRININPWAFRISSIIFSILGTLLVFGIAAIIYLIMPDKIEKMADTIEPHIGRRIGIGFLTLVASPIALIIVSILLAITIIGIIAIPFVWIAFLLAVLVALVPVYVYIGRKTGQIVAGRSIKSYGALAIGIFVIWLINLLLSLGGAYTGWITTIISIFVFVLGTGTVLDYMFSNRKPKVKFNYNMQAPPQGAGFGPQGYGYTKPEENKNTNNADDNIPKDDNK